MIRLRYKFLLLAILSIFYAQIHGSTITTMNKNDPAPLFSSYQPNNFLITHQRENIKGFECFEHEERFGFAISPFHQKASSGRSWDITTTSSDTCPSIPIGDLEGPWHMLGLLYSCTTNDEIEAKYTNQLPTLEKACEAIFGSHAPIINPSEIVSDPNQKFGFFSVPIRYRKTGVRFALHARPFCNWGISLYGGVAEIKQTITGLDNLTTNTPVTITLPNADECSSLTKDCCEIINLDACTVNDYLMTPSVANQIFKELGFPDGTCAFRQASMEDLYFQIWWRHPFAINTNEPVDDCGCYYPRFLFIPFMTVNAIIPVAKKKDRKELFALPFGNDQHAAIGGNAGFWFDFYETLEIGLEGGAMHFFEQTFDRFFLPTQQEQYGIFPCFTTVRRNPGNTFHIGATLHAFHFLCNLSAYAQFLFVSHKEDSLKVKNHKVAYKFKPKILECRSKWEVHLLNTGLNYDISTNATLGFAAQWPLRQKNAYRSTTFLGTVRVTF